MFLVGPIVVTGMNDDGETIGLTDEQVTKVQAVLAEALRPFF
jgi:hypothetical protein